MVEENSRVIEKTIRENREFLRELLQRHEWFTQQVVAELKDLQDQTKARPEPYSACWIASSPRGSD